MHYTEENRGVIQDQEHFHQKILFDGIQYGKCMPTDIDAAMEFGGKVLILYEVKYGSARVPYGQSLLLQRLADAWDGEAVLFVCRHKEHGDIHLRETLVTDVYYKGRWHKEKVVKNARDRTREFIEYCERVCGISLQLEGVAEDKRRLQA